MTAIQLEHFLSELRTCVGAAHVLTQALDTWSYTEDWRKKYHGKALAVVSPGSTEEVAAVMKAACTYKVPVVTQGGNTGLSGGATPDDSGLQIVLNESWSSCHQSIPEHWRTRFPASQRTW